MSFRPTVADDAAMAFDVYNIWDSNQQPKHHRMNAYTFFHYKIYTPPSL